MDSSEKVTNVVLVSPKIQSDIRKEHFDEDDTSSVLQLKDNELVYIEESNEWSMDLSNTVVINKNNINSVQLLNAQISEQGKLFAGIISALGGFIATISSIYLFRAFDVGIESLESFPLAIIGLFISLGMIIYGLSLFSLTENKLIITCSNKEYIFEGENLDKVLQHILDN